MVENEQGYRLLFESNPLPMWVYDLDTLEFLAVNDAAIRNYEYSREEFLQKTIKDIRPPEDVPSLLRKVARVKTGFNNSEGRHRKKDGTIIEVEIVSHTLDFAGRRAELVLAIDITERKHAEAEHLELVRAQAARVQAEAEQRRLEFLAQASNLLISSLDYKTTLKSVARLAVPTLADHSLIDLLEENGAMNRVEVACADPKKKELAGRLKQYPPNLNRMEVPVSRAIQSRQLVFLPEISDSMLVDASANEEHLRILRALGPTSLVVAPLIARGRILGAMSFSLAESGRHYGTADLSLIEELAKCAALAVDNALLYHEAQLANRAKDDFLATVSHELRTPLTSMLFWTRMLAADKLDSATSSQALNSISRSVKSLSTLVDDLLDVSGIVAHRLLIDACEIELIPTIEAALEVIGPIAEAKGIRVEMFLDPTVKAVHGDPDRLQQVIWNLVSNAIKFSHEGGRVVIRLENAITEVRIIIVDEGEGISPDLLPYVFDRFKQGDSSDIRRYGGLGLGLTIVRHLVELHGGTVTAASDGVGRGSTFTVTLPRVLTAEREANKMLDPNLRREFAFTASTKTA